MNNLSKIFSIIFLINIVVKITDVIRNLLISSRLGVSANADIYMAVMSIPDLILIILGFDTIKGIVNSEYSSLHSENRLDDLKLSFSNLLKLLSFFGALLIILAIVLRYQIIGLLLPGFTGSKKDASIYIFLIILPIFFIRNLMNLFQSVCNAYKKYFYPVVLPILVNIFVIVSVILAFTKDTLIYYIAVAGTFGNIIIAMILALIVYSLIGKIKINAKLDAVTIKILKSISSLLILVMINQIYFASRNYFASYLGDGSISVLNYANMPVGFINTFIFTVFFSVLLSELSSKFTLGEIENARHMFFDTLLSLLYFCVPLILIMIIFNTEFLKLLFLRGNLKAEDIEKISYPFFWETLAILPFILFILSVALYLASKQYVLITKIGSLVFVLGIVLNYVFASKFGIYGISLANFITSSLYAITLLFFLRQIVGKIGEYSKKIFSIFFSGIVVFLLFFSLKRFVFNYFVSNSILSDALLILFNTILIFCVYYFCTSFLKVNYLKKVKDSLFFKIGY